MRIPSSIQDVLKDLISSRGKLVVLTGAGISADSGIPTFRGKEGIWTIGSREYQPQELATAAMFAREPEQVWAFYLYRVVTCRDAQPNPGHRELVKWEQRFGDHFHLITQNVDGLHLLAGNCLTRTYQIHGNIRFLRCWDDCGQEKWSLDIGALSARQKHQTLTADERRLLRCPKCGGWARPHVLWFDEYYDEAQFYFESSLRAASSADLLIVIGTSGATNLPMQVAHLAANSGGVVIEVNQEASAFSKLADQTGGGLIEGGASQVLPAITKVWQSKGARF